jgi:hypothetical protein
MMDFTLLLNIAGPAGVQRYPEEEALNLKRPIITQLYRVRKKTLHEVRQVLWQQYDFRVR